MRVIGITGGVGCGKSAVMDFAAEQYKAVVLKADLIGHLLMEPGMRCYDAIVAHFGQDILKKDKSIDRGKIAAIVFSDEKELQIQSAIMQPAIREYILQRIERAKKDQENYCFVEAALFFEDHYDDFCDEVWYIYADAATRRVRLKESRGYTDAKIDDVIKSQLSEDLFRSRCDFTLDNSGDFEITKKQIQERMQSIE